MLNSLFVVSAEIISLLVEKLNRVDGAMIVNLQFLFERIRPVWITGTKESITAFLLTSVRLINPTMQSYPVEDIRYVARTLQKPGQLPI